MKTVLQRLRHTLLVPAAEYVPAITDALDIIDAALSLPDPLQALADTHAALDLTYENTTPSRSKRMAEAGFTQRDTRLTCDECGKKYMPQMLPIHGCLPDPSAAPVVPQGWKLVPVEPTPEMLNANGLCEFEDGQKFLHDDARRTWGAMLNAAPAPQQGEQAGQEGVQG